MQIRAQSYDARNVEAIPLSAIEPSETRIDGWQDIRDLASSLSIHGQISPICVRRIQNRRGGYQVVFGNRRLRAAKHIGWKTITAEVVDISVQDALAIAFCENSDRVDFSDYEKALLMEKIHSATGKNYAEVAGLIGKSPAYVSQHIAMLHLFSADIGEADEKARVLYSLTENHCRILSRIEDFQERWNTAKLAVASHMGVRELEKIVARHSNLSGELKIDKSTTIPSLIKDIIKGTTGRDITPFSSLVCKEHFTMFSSFDQFKEMPHDEAIKHVAKAVANVENWNQKIEDLRFRGFGNVCYATFVINHRMTKRHADCRARTRATLIFEKEGGQWKLTHGHWSSLCSDEQIHLSSLLA